MRCELNMVILCGHSKKSDFPPKLSTMCFWDRPREILPKVFPRVPKLCICLLRGTEVSEIDFADTYVEEDQLMSMGG